MSTCKPSTNPVVNRITDAIFDSDLIASRIVLAMAELFWAVLLLWPGDSFSRPTYGVMAHVMPEDAWALVFLVSAITQITIVILNDYHSRFSRYFAAWNAALWGFCVVAMLLSVYPPPAAIGGEIALAFSSLWIWARPLVIRMGVCRVLGN